MRLLMTTDTVGGVWTYTRELSMGLLEAGCEITLVSMGRPLSEEQNGWVSMMTTRWQHDFHLIATDYKLEWMQDNAGCYEQSRDFLMEYVHRYAPDILHTNQFCYGALPVSVPKVLVAHSDVLSWWRTCRGGVPEDSEWIANYRSLVSNGIRSADIIVTPTAWMLEQIRFAYGIRGATAVINNGRTLSAMPSRHRKLQAVTAGRLWDEAKNVQLLAELRTEIPIYVAGDEAFEAPSDVSALKVKTLGRLTDTELLRLFAQSAIYVVTSRYEPFGLAAVEAALSGCAIVSNGIASLREVWGEVALYFAENNAASLECVLQHLAASPASLQDAAQRAFARARRCFSRERMTAEYLALYRTLLSSRIEHYGT